MSIATPNGFQLDNSGKRVVVDPITRIEGKWKLSQNRDAADRRGGVAGLRDAADAHRDPALADRVEGSMEA